MPVLRLLKTEAFDPQVSEIVAAAFSSAWNVLRKSGSTLAANEKAVMTRRVLATQIIAVARTGERDQQRLAREALAYVASCAKILRSVERPRPNFGGRGSSKPDVHCVGEVGHVEGES